jgi:hypothetical protein
VGPRVGHVIHGGVVMSGEQEIQISRKTLRGT